MTHSIREANAKLCEIGATLRAGDFKGSVLVVTHDSIQFFDNALAKTYGEWLLVWTEHCGYFVHHEDEVTNFRFMEHCLRLGEIAEVV
jgi:hypothetical protein